MCNERDLEGVAPVRQAQAAVRDFAQAANQLARHDDAAAFVEGIVVDDLVPANDAAVAQTKVGDASAVLTRVVAADLVTGDSVVVCAVEDADAAGETDTAVVQNPVVVNVDIVVEVVAPVWLTNGDAATEVSAVALDNVVADLQILAEAVHMQAASDICAVSCPRDLEAVDLWVEGGVEEVVSSACHVEACTADDEALIQDCAAVTLDGIAGAIAL